MNTYRTYQPLKLLCIFALVLAFTPHAGAQPTAPGDAQTLEKLEQGLNQTTVRTAFTEAQWQAYSNTIEEALHSGREAFEQAAMRMIIQYGDHLTIDRASVFKLVHLYRDHSNDRVRRMAVVALGQSKDPWALDFLARSARFEDSAPVRHTIRAVVAASKNTPLGPSKAGY